MSDVQVAWQTYGVSVVGPYAGFQINGPRQYVFNTTPYTQRSQGYFQISPPGPDNTTQNVIAYNSVNWAWPTDWAAGQAYSLGAKVAGVANIYICTDAITTSATRPSVVTGSETDGDGQWTVYTEPYPIAADTDFVLFDDELMIEGLRWAWYRAKKQGYEQERADWMTQIRSVLGRQNGGAIVNAGYDVNNNTLWPITPNGNFPSW